VGRTAWDTPTTVDSETPTPQHPTPTLPPPSHWYFVSADFAA